MDSALRLVFLAALDLDLETCEALEAFPVEGEYLAPDLPGGTAYLAIRNPWPSRTFWFWVLEKDYEVDPSIPGEDERIWGGD